MRNAIWRKCCGEAHGNAYIDNCWTCAPYWEMFPACPDCGGKLKAVRVARYISTGQRVSKFRGRCTNSACASVRRWFLTEAEPEARNAWTWFCLTWTEIGVSKMRGES